MSVCLYTPCARYESRHTQGGHGALLVSARVSAVPVGLALSLAQALVRATSCITRFALPIDRHTVKPRHTYTHSFSLCSSFPWSVYSWPLPSYGSRITLVTQSAAQHWPPCAACLVYSLEHLVAPGVAAAAAAVAVLFIHVIHTFRAIDLQRKSCLHQATRTRSKRRRGAARREGLS